MDQRYLPTTTAGKMGRLVEECGEVLAAVGKAQRWGLESVNPELQITEQESNRDWVLREIDDLIDAAFAVKEELSKGGQGDMASDGHR